MNEMSGLRYLGQGFSPEEREIALKEGFLDYTKEVLKNCNELTDHVEAMSLLCRKDMDRLLHGMVGLASETGEVVSELKSHLFQGEPLNKDNIEEEIGDVLFYVALILSCLGDGYSLNSVINKSLVKLKGKR